MTKYKELNSTYFPEGYYISKADAAKWLGVKPNSLFYHIKVGHLPTILMAGAHHINIDDLMMFQKSQESINTKNNLLTKFERLLAFIEYLETYKPNVYGPNLRQQVMDWLSDNYNDLSDFPAAQKAFNSYMGWTTN